MILNPCFAALDTLVTSFNKGKSLCWRTAQKSLPERQPHARVLDLVLSQPEKTQASHKPSTPGAQRQLLCTSQLQRDDRGNSPPCQGGGGRKKKRHLQALILILFFSPAGSSSQPTHGRQLDLAACCLQANSWGTCGAGQVLCTSMFWGVASCWLHPSSVLFEGEVFPWHRRESKESRCSGTP